MDLHFSSKEIGDSPKQCEIILLGNQESESVKVASEKDKGIGKHNFIIFNYM